MYCVLLCTVVMSVYFYSWYFHILLCLHIVLSDMHFPGKADGGGKMHVTLCDLIMPWESTSATQKKSLSQRYQMGCDCKVINRTALSDIWENIYTSVGFKITVKIVVGFHMINMTVLHNHDMFQIPWLGILSTKQR